MSNEWAKAERHIAENLSRNIIMRDYPNTDEFTKGGAQLYELGIRKGWVEAQAKILAYLVLNRPKARKP